MKRGRRILLIVIFAMVGGLAVRMLSGGGVRVEPGSTLVVPISGQYVEAAQPPLFARVFDDGGRPFLSLLSTLKLAQRDDRIETVILRIGDAGIGWGKAAELRSAIEGLRAAGRRTIAFLEMQSFAVNRAYYVATAADEIHVVPGAVMPLVGLAAEYLYFGEMWEKLGIAIEATKVGKYKSAVETFADRGMSDASREMSNALLDSAEQRFVSAIANGRRLPERRVREIINEGFVSPTDLLERGLIDGIKHLGELQDPDSPVIHASTYASVDPDSTGYSPVLDVALVYGSGLVVSGGSSQSSTGAPLFASERVVDALEDAAADPNIAGIVLRIDSPGGSPLASEVMWNAVQTARESGKPVVVSVSDVAASGGYYVASAADAIVISPGALTGSIGVFALRPVFEELMKKIGVASESLQRGRHADFFTATRPLSDENRARMQALAEEIYRLFLERVASGRDLDIAQVDTLGQGRVWSADQALEVGLVDELGGIREAVDWILRDLGHELGADVSLITYPEPPTLAKQIADLLQTGSFGAAPSTTTPLDVLIASLPLPPVLGGLREWIAASPSGGPMLLPSTLIDIR